MGPMGEQPVPQQFSGQVHDLLAHLFDPVRLQEHPLVDTLVGRDVGDSQARAQGLREVVLSAIGDLRPPSGTPQDDPAYRPYAIIRQRYADGFTREEVQRNLAISRRQFFREQQRALDALVRLLWERRLPEAGATLAADAVEEGLDQLEVSVRAFEIGPSARQAVAAVKRLADGKGVALLFEDPHAALVYADEAVTRQLVIGVLSLLLHSYGGRYLRISTGLQGDSVCLTFRGIRAGADLQRIVSDLSDLRRLGARTGAGLSLVGQEDPAVVLRLPLAPGRLVTVVDDNPRTLQLFKRYLEPYHFTVVTAPSGKQALAIISELRPDAVVLDVMMQEVDGWQVLQELKTDPRTRAIPVIICSVLNEAELAKGLGADLYLRKPVSQLELVRALTQVKQQ
jgi:CheY-like chemotaxis protein